MDNQTRLEMDNSVSFVQNYPFFSEQKKKEVLEGLTSLEPSVRASLLAAAEQVSQYAYGEFNEGGNAPRNPST
jgi:hypothetical protein